MSVRAKFFVESVNRHVGGADVMLRPVTGGSPENESFYKYTPGGNIELTTINLGAADQFVPGEEFYVDFTRCEKTAE